MPHTTIWTYTWFPTLPSELIPGSQHYHLSFYLVPNTTIWAFTWFPTQLSELLPGSQHYHLSFYLVPNTTIWAYTWFPTLPSELIPGSQHYHLSFYLVPNTTIWAYTWFPTLPSELLPGSQHYHLSSYLVPYTTIWTCTWFSTLPSQPTNEVFYKPCIPEVGSILYYNIAGHKLNKSKSKFDTYFTNISDEPRLAWYIDLQQQKLLKGNQIPLNMTNISNRATRPEMAKTWSVNWWRKDRYTIIFK